MPLLNLSPPPPPGAAPASDEARFGDETAIAQKVRRKGDFHFHDPSRLSDRGGDGWRLPRAARGISAAALAVSLS